MANGGRYTSPTDPVGYVVGNFETFFLDNYPFFGLVFHHDPCRIYNKDSRTEQQFLFAPTGET